MSTKPKEEKKKGTKKDVKLTTLTEAEDTRKFV